MYAFRGGRGYGESICRAMSGGQRRASGMFAKPDQPDLIDRDRDGDTEAEDITTPQFPVATQWAPSRQDLVIPVGWAPGYRCREGCHVYSPALNRRLRGGRQSGSLRVTTT